MLFSEVARAVVGHHQRQPPSACTCCSASSLVSGAGAAAALSAAAACPSGDRAMHSAASLAVAKQPRLTDLPPRHTRARLGLGLAGVVEGHAEVARRVVGHAQRQPFRLRLLRASSLDGATGGCASRFRLGIVGCFLVRYNLLRSRASLRSRVSP